MERDESGDTPRAPSDEPDGSGWTVEDFDTFAPFDGEDGDDGGEKDSSGQGTLGLEPGTADGGAPEDLVRPDSGSAEQDVPSDDADDRPGLDPENSAAEAADDLAEVEAEEEVAAEVVSAFEGGPAVEEFPQVLHPEAGQGTEVPSDATAMPDDAESEDDTVEARFEGGAAAGAAPAEEEDVVEVPDFASFTSDEYVQATTQEFVDLAEEVARNADIDHEQSAISAEIPGLESGIVGLDDVVAASGADPAAIPVAPRSNMGSRVFTGLGLAAIFFASLTDSLLVGAFILVVLTLSAGEFYSALMRAGYRPLGLFGLAGAIGALAGTWAWGLIAVPVAVSATLVLTLIFFALVGERRTPMLNVALTVMGTLWVGGMGAFLFEMVQAEDYGWLIVATVVTVAAMDIGSFFFGRRLGRHRLAPRVSPKKTVEGLVAGVLVAILVGVAFGLREPFDLGSGLALGLIVAVAAPFGDLAVSVLKRSIGAKDMGTLLPGHGGLLDRIDAMLFVMPLAWIAFTWTGLLP